MSKTKNLVQTNLSINDLELPVYLGWPSNERKHPQLVSISIHILFNEIPAACLSDNLDDTFCYSWLVEEIKKKTSEKPIHLIEHLSKRIHDIIQELLPEVAMLSISVTKKPEIAGLKNGVTFSCVSFKENNET